jgi:hypothetical protein
MLAKIGPQGGTAELTELLAARQLDLLFEF